MAQGSIEFLGDEDGDFSAPTSHNGVHSFRLTVRFTPPPIMSTVKIENFTATPVDHIDNIDNLNFTPMLSKLRPHPTIEGIWSFSLTPKRKAAIDVGIRVDGITDKNGNGYSPLPKLTNVISYKPPKAPVFTALDAQAGPDQDNVASGAPVTLDGTGSTQTGGGRDVTYLWARTGGTMGGTVTLTGDTTLTPSFTADTLTADDDDVEHIITLTVMDNQGTPAATDTVTITVKAPGFTALDAQAGPDQDNVASGAPVTLDGTGSTQTGGGRNVTYLWARTGGTQGGSVTLTGDTTLAPSFTADTLTADDDDVEHIITLTVMDNQGTPAATDTVTITVKAPGFTALVAQAGPDQDNVASGAPVTLDGTGSTRTGGGRDVTYLWARTGGTTGGTVTLTGDTTLAPSFTADTLNPADDDVEHIITLTVMDNQGTPAATDTVTITVKAPGFTALVAQAGPDQDNVASGAPVTLDGTGSTRTGGGRNVTYLWARTGGTTGGTVTLTGDTTLAPSFTADTLNPADDDVEHIITLTVTDDKGSTAATDTVMVTVTAVLVDILVKPSDLTVQEGGSGTYQVSLSESPRREVSVIASPDHEDVVPENARLVFNAENWDTWQDVRINTVADADKVDDTARIRHSLDADGVALGQAGIVTVRLRDKDPILRDIGNYLASRATALLNNQPDLIRFLKQDETTQGRNFTLKATEGRLAMDGGFVYDGVWGEVTGSYGNSDSGDTKSVLGSFGIHRKYSENLLVGAMLQFNLSDHVLAGNIGRIDGTVWLVGPYFAARHGSQPLYFEGRLLYGESDNDIRFIDRDLGIRTGSFDTTQLLAQIRVEGEIALSDRDEGPRLIPYADARWIEDRAKAFNDGIGNRFVNRVPGQKVSTGQLELGSNVEIPVAVNHGEMTLTGGLGLVYANTEGDYITSDSRGRGRGEIGFSYGLDDNVRIDFESFYDGIGTSRYEGYGLSLSAEMKF